MKKKKIVIRPYRQLPKAPSYDSSRTVILNALESQSNLQKAYELAWSLPEKSLLEDDIISYIENRASQINGRTMAAIIPSYEIFQDRLVMVQHVVSPKYWGIGLKILAKSFPDLYPEWLQALLNDWQEVDTTQRRLLQSVWYSWQDLQLLDHARLFQDLKQYWQGQSTSSTLKAVDFIDYCWKKHEHCQEWSWLPSLTPLIEGHLLAPRLDALLQDQMPELIGKLPILWKLASRIPQAPQKITEAICKYAKQKGLECLQSQNVINDLLELHLNLQEAIKDVPATISLKNVWEDVLNRSESAAELLAKHLDVILKNDKKLMAQTSDWLTHIMTLFSYLQAKDVFEAFYKSLLAKRLLWNRFVNMDVEKHICSLLKAECGAAFTSKMEGMFQDVDWSRETMAVYQQQRQSAAGSNIPEMEVQVLTTGYWPVYPQYPNLVLPASLLALQEDFGQHYKSKYQGRRMTWQYALGHVVVKCTLNKKPYELIVSLVQALVLMQFNDHGQRSLAQLQASIGVEADELERALLSLTQGKDGTRILKCREKKKRYTADDVFAVNEKFTSKLRRIRISNILWKETKQERDETHKVVSRDRLYLLDAVLVRILKSRKTISHPALMAQVLEQVKVPAKASDVKLRIESLIEREYMERDAQDRNRYNYLA